MKLTPGQRLGPYEIVSRLGEGGMGEVYRARDTQLNRDVAIKVLPELFAADPDRLARFTREAQTLAALNHPNIAQIYGVVESALVMELVEGEDLSQRIARGQIPIDDAVAIARQVADALEAAHERGIVHRDLKPANVKMRTDGVVKVLDFGLAKAMDPAAAAGPEGPAYGPGDNVMNSPTFTSPAAFTQLGVILGTAAYMAPEQARGKPVDRRADIWAFGALLFELLTRRLPFGGETVTDTLSAIISRDPDWTALPASTPPHVQALLTRCLEKDPRKRLQAIGEARIALEQNPAAPAGSAARRGGAWLPIAFAAAGLAAGALLTWLATRDRGARGDAPAAQLEMSVTPAESVTGPFAISPDGSTVAFVGTVGTGYALYARRLDRDTAVKIVDSGVSNMASPAFSPDGQWIAFSSIGQIKKVSVDGGNAVPLAQANVAMSFPPAWGADDVIVFANQQYGLSRIRASGGTAEVVTVIDVKAGETEHTRPVLLSDGKTVLYNVDYGHGVMKAVAQPLAGGARKALFDGAVFGVVGGDRLALARQDGVYSVPFDMRGVAVTGEPTRLLSDVAGLGSRELWSAPAPLAAVARNGTIVYRPAVAREQRPLVFVDGHGAATAIELPPHVFSDPRVSPDGTRIAVHGFEAGRDNWVVDLGRRTLTRVTFDQGEDESPLWSPDGRWLYWTSTRSGLARGIFRRPADGSAPESLVWKGSSHLHLGGITPDGGTLIVALEADDHVGVVAVRLGDGAVTPLVKSSFDNSHPALSADGTLLAYVSNESGRDEIYVQPYPSLRARAVVSAGGGVEPIWGRKGHELFYRANGQIMSATIGAPLTPSASRVVMPDAYDNTQGNYHTCWDVAPDGRFVFVNRAPAEAKITHLRMLYRPN